MNPLRGAPLPGINLDSTGPISGAASPDQPQAEQAERPRVPSHSGYEALGFAERASIGESPDPRLRAQDSKAAHQIPVTPFASAATEREQDELLAESGVTSDAKSAAGASPVARGPHRWKAENRFIISLDESDSLVRNNAKAEAVDRGVPAGNFFHTNRRNKAGSAFGLHRRQVSHPMGRQLSFGSLSKVTQSDRLAIHAHGSPADLGVGRQAFEPPKVAKLLRLAGLKEVGVLKFQSCEVGMQDHLEKMLAALTAEGIKVGYLAGYQAGMNDNRLAMRIGSFRFNIRHPALLLALALPPFWESAITRRSVGGSDPASSATRVVKGNVDIAFPGTRYDFSGPPATSRDRGWALANAFEPDSLE